MLTVRSSLLLHREAEVAALREQSVTLLQAEARQREEELRAAKAQVQHPARPAGAAAPAPPGWRPCK